MKFPRGVSILCATDALLTFIILYATLAGPAEPATHDFDIAAAFGVSILFAVTALPALLLARRRPKMALGFALAFPAIFIAGFAAAFAIFAF